MIVDWTNAPHYVWRGDCDGWVLLPRGDLNVIHERMPPGRSEVRHRHEAARQFFFVLSGALTMELDGVEHLIPSGSGLEIAPGAADQAMNRGRDAVEFLVVSHPTTRGDRIDLGR